MDENEKDEFTLKEMLFGDDKEYEEYKIYLEEEKRKEDEKRRIEQERSRSAIEYANRKVNGSEKTNLNKIIIPDEVENADIYDEIDSNQEPIKNYYNKENHSNSNPIRMHEYRKNMNNYLNYENMSEIERNASRQNIEYVYRHELAKKGWAFFLAIWFGISSMGFALYMNTMHDQEVNKEYSSSQSESISVGKYTRPDSSVDIDLIKENGGKIINYAYAPVIAYTSPVEVDIPTYYGSSKQDNVIVSAYYPIDNRFKKNSVNTIVIEYKNLTQDNVDEYEKTLLSNGYKEDLNYTKGTLFVKKVSDTSYGFSLRENNTYTYGVTWIDIYDALKYHDYSNDPIYTQE